MKIKALFGAMFGLLALNSGLAAANEPVDLNGSAVQPAAFNSGSPVYQTPPWAHRSGAFGELLVLRARDAEISYALPVNGNVPQGDVGILDPEAELGFRVGLTKALDNCSSFSLSYTGYSSSQADQVDVNAPLSLAKLLVHPNEANAAANVLSASGSYDIDFQLADLDYRFVVLSNACTAANLTIGARYGRLDQDLSVVYTGAGLTETVTSDIEFNGAGLRLGADIEHHLRRGTFLYGKTNASLLAGKFDASYLHSSNVDPIRVSSGWDAGRMVSMLDLEVGAGWQHCCGLRVTAGYMFNSWMGTVKTEDWIGAVQNNAGNYRDLSDDFTFDGFVTRFEYHF